MPKNEQDIKWACNNCTYENWTSAIKCTLCYAPRPPHVTPRTRKPSGISETSGKTNEIITNDPLICPASDKNTQQPAVKWYCHGCTYENWPKSSRCVMCFAPKPKVLTKSTRKTSNGETAGGNKEKGREISPKFSRASNKLEAKISNNDKNRNISSLKSQKWVCPKCTYENWPKTTDCVLCRYPRHTLSPKSKNEEIGRNSVLDLRKNKTATRRRSPNTSVSEPSLAIQTANQEEDTIIYDIAASSNRNDSDEVRQICNRMTESDWMWLNACIGVVENEPSAVESYLNAGGDSTTQLTREDVLVLNRPGVFELGYTLVHLAVRFHREELLTLLLTPEVATKAFKKVPSHVSPELAAEVRKEISHTLRQRKGDWPCYFFTNQVTFALQAEIQDFCPRVQIQLFDEILDKAVQKVLEMESPVINWSKEITEQLGSRVYSLWNRSAGDCLLDSILQATYGVFDNDNTLRKALYESLSEGGGRFFPRWKEWESMQAETLQYSLDEDQWEQDWASILSLASQPGTSLEQTHVFALAHILRRPIIIYGVKYVKSFRGETLGLARFEGVYLPLLWEQSFCWKNPVVLGYTRGHFSALVPMETDHVNDVGAGANVDSNDDVHVTYLPLIDHQGQLLRVHFLTGAELGSEERLLREWLDCCVTRGGILVAQQRITSRPALVNQLLDEWLDRYRKLNK